MISSNPHPVAIRHLEVLSVDDVGDRIRRVTLGGDQLGTFDAGPFAIAAFRSDAPDDHVKIFLPDPTTGELTLPEQDDGHLDWPDDPRPIHRDYTVRRFDPVAGELDLEFVLHGGGIAASWASSAQRGDRLHVAGPRRSHVFPAATELVLLGDETALPAIGRWIDEAPPGTSVTARILVEHGHSEVVLPMPDHLRLDIRTIAADREETLVDAVRELPELGDDVFVFVAGEFDAVGAVRTELRERRRLDPARWHVTSYWRRGEDDPELADVANGLALIAMVDLLTPNAIRVVATLGIADLIQAGTDTTEALAAATGSDHDTLAAIIEHLVVKEVFGKGADGRLSLGGTGQLLVDGHPFEARRQLRLDGAEGRMDMAWGGLLHAATTGRPGWDAVFGQSFWDAINADDDFARSFNDYLERWALTWAPSAVQSHDWSRYRHVVDAGGGSGMLLGGIVAAAPEVRGTLVEMPAAVAAAQQRFETSGIAERAAAVAGDFFEPLPNGDAIVLAQVLHDWPDADAARILRRAGDAAGPGGRVLLIERVRVAGGPDHGQIHLLMRNLFGAIERDLDQFAALAAAADLVVRSVVGLDGGLSLIELGGSDR